MHLLDVNVLVYAFDADTKDHKAYRLWLENLLQQNESFGVSSLIFSGFMRVVTLPKILLRPATPSVALAFVDAVRNATNFIDVAPGPRHWDIFADLVRSTNAKGNDVPDAFHAALAIESGCTWATADRGFSRFKNLRLIHPLRK
jgi:uncharacterized protein